LPPPERGGAGADAPRFPRPPLRRSVRQERTARVPDDGSSSDSAVEDEGSALAHTMRF